MSLYVGNFKSIIKAAHHNQIFFFQGRSPNRRLPDHVQTKIRKLIVNTLLAMLMMMMTLLTTLTIMTEVDQCY